jgi:hypothetical protein
VGPSEKYSIYLARASNAEAQAANTKDMALKTVLLRTAKEYRQAAEESRRDGINDAGQTGLPNA